MDRDASDEPTGFLVSARGGNRAALDELMPLVYRELRRLAGGYFRSERPDHTLQPTALADEVYIRLVDQSRVELNDRPHFFAIAGRMMRRVLVDHARSHRAQKRGSGAPDSSSTSPFTRRQRPRSTRWTSARPASWSFASSAA